MVIVSLDDVKLKLTCNNNLLEKSFVEAVLEPFLTAFNEKRGTTHTSAKLAKIVVDRSKDVTDKLSLPAKDVLEGDPTLDVSRVELAVHAFASCSHTAAPAADDASSSRAADVCRRALVRLLDLPDDAPSGEWLQPLQELRAISRDHNSEPGVAALLFTPKLLSLTARIAGLASASALPSGSAPPWTAASAEAAVLLNNLLVLDRNLVGTALCTPEHLEDGVGALPAVSDALEHAAQLPLQQLRLLAQIAFHLSLVPAASPFANDFLTAARHALTWVTDSVLMPGSLDDVDMAASFAADLVRTLFNLLRTAPPDIASSTDRAAVEELLMAAAALLRNDGRSDELKQAKLAALQIPVVLPAELAYPALRSEWRRVLEVTHELLVACDKPGASEQAGREPVLPLVVLKGIVDSDATIRDEAKRFLFPPGCLSAQFDPKDPYRPAGELPGFDPNAPLPANASTRARLIKQLTSMDHTLKRVAGEFLLALCADDTHEFVRLCGLGSAAGLLQEKDQMGAFAHIMQG